MFRIAGYTSILLVVGILNLLCTDAIPRACRKCQKSNECKPPKCVCCNEEMPIPKEQVPQMVFFTFDDAVNTHIARFYRQLFHSNRRNPNGCPISMTLFISHANTVYKLVREFYQKGMEIASHSVTHSHMNATTLKNEAKKQRENLARMARIPVSKIKGWRSPFLEPVGDAQPNTLQNVGYSYDATLTYTKGVGDKRPPIPFTLDYGWPYDCKIKPCPRRHHKGFWEVPVVSLKDYLGKYECVYVDGCTNPPPDEEAAYNFLWDNFNAYYKTTKAPFGINMHAAWFYHGDRLKAMDRFIKDLVKLDDVYIVSVKQVISWLKSPTSLQEIKTFRPWSCKGSNSSSSFQLRNNQIQKRLQELQQSKTKNEQANLARRQREWENKQKSVNSKSSVVNTNGRKRTRGSMGLLPPPTPHLKGAQTESKGKVTKPFWSTGFKWKKPESYNTNRSKPRKTPKPNLKRNKVDLGNPTKSKQSEKSKLQILEEKKRAERERHKLIQQEKIRKIKERNRIRQEQRKAARQRKRLEIQRMTLQKQRDNEKNAYLENKQKYEIQQRMLKEDNKNPMQIRESPFQNNPKQMQKETIVTTHDETLIPQKHVNAVEERPTTLKQTPIKEGVKPYQGQVPGNPTAIVTENNKQATKTRDNRRVQEQQHFLTGKNVSANNNQADNMETILGDKQNIVPKSSFEMTMTIEQRQEKVKPSQVQVTEKPEAIVTINNKHTTGKSAAKTDNGYMQQQEKYLKGRNATLSNTQIDNVRTNLGDKQNVIMKPSLEKTMAPEQRQEQINPYQVQVSQMPNTTVSMNNKQTTRNFSNTDKTPVNSNQTDTVGTIIGDKQNDIMKPSLEKTIAIEHRELQRMRIKKLKQIIKQKLLKTKKLALQKLKDTKSITLMTRQSRIKRFNMLIGKEIKQLLQQEPWRSWILQYRQERKKYTEQNNQTLASTNHQNETLIHTSKPVKDQEGVSHQQNISSNVVIGSVQEVEGKNYSSRREVDKVIRLTPTSTPKKTSSPQTDTYYHIMERQSRKSAKQNEKNMVNKTRETTEPLLLDFNSNTFDRAAGRLSSSKISVDRIGGNAAVLSTEKKSDSTTHPKYSVLFETLNYTRPAIQASLSRYHEQDVLKHRIKPTKINPNDSVRSKATCRQDVNCIAPECFCKTDNTPFDLPTENLPQIIYVTIEGKMNFVSYSKLKSLFTKTRTNPNGCRISGTFFASQRGTSYRLANILHKEGMEISLNGDKSVNYNTSENMRSNIGNQMQKLVDYSRLPPGSIKGWRSPKLMSFGDSQFDVLKNLSLYDSSLITNRTASGDKKIWPFTLDFGLNEPCLNTKCPLKNHPGVWEIPITPVVTGTTTCNYVDTCNLQPRNEKETFEFLMDNFNSYYNTNKAPFGIHISQRWFYWYFNRNLSGLSKFLDHVLKRHDVYIVSISDMIEWMKSPTTLDGIRDFNPWQC